jgi:alpha-amylase
VCKSIELTADRPALDIRYTLDELPAGATLHFAVEFNLASMAGHAPDRYYSDASHSNLGMLDTRLELAKSDEIIVTDEWIDLVVSLSWSQPAGLWCWPIATVSQSEGGYEGVYQSSAVVPHWLVEVDRSRRWEVRIGWSLDRFSTVTTGAGMPRAKLRAAEERSESSEFLC